MLGHCLRSYLMVRVSAMQGHTCWTQEISFMLEHDFGLSTSNVELRYKQSNHKTDESQKTYQSVGLFGQLFLLLSLSFIIIMFMTQIPFIGLK